MKAEAATKEKAIEQLENRRPQTRTPKKLLLKRRGAVQGDLVVSIQKMEKERRDEIEKGLEIITTS